MAFVRGVNQAKVNLDMTVSGEGASTGFYILDTTSLNQQRLDEAASLVSNWAATTFIPLLSNQTTYNGVTLYDMASTDAPRSQIILGSPVSGANSGDALPGNVALVATLDSGGRGRTARGRMYIPGNAENLWDGERFAPDLVNLMRSALETLQTSLQTANFELIVSSSIFNGAPRADRLAQPVTAIVVKIKPGTQKRRVRYGDGL